MKTLLIRKSGKGVLVKGVLNLSVIIGIYPKCRTLQKTFMVIKTDLSYNTILRRPLLYKINVIINTEYLTMKFLIKKNHDC